MHDWYPQRLEDGIVSLKTEVTDSCEQQCGCWELNTSALEKQSVFITAKLSLQPPNWIVYHQKKKKMLISMKKKINPYTVIFFLTV
jgi:hypothetical protein